MYCFRETRRLYLLTEILKKIWSLNIINQLRLFFKFHPVSGACGSAMSLEAISKGFKDRLQPNCVRCLLFGCFAEVKDKCPVQIDFATAKDRASTWSNSGIWMTTGLMFFKFLLNFQASLKLHMIIIVCENFKISMRFTCIRREFFPPLDSAVYWVTFYFLPWELSLILSEYEVKWNIHESMFCYRFLMVLPIYSSPRETWS